MAYGVNAPFGFRPWGSLAGGQFSPKTNDYLIAASADGTQTYVSNIFTGDPVYFNRFVQVQPTNNTAGAGGTICLVADSFPAPGNPGQLPVGVFAGVKYTDTSGMTQWSPYWPGATQVAAGTPIIASVWDDPFIVWDIQVSTSDGANSGNTLAIVKQQWFGNNLIPSIGRSGGIVVNPVGGNTNTGLSGFYLDGFSDGNTSTEQVRVLKLTPIEGTNNKPSPNLIANTVPYLNGLALFNSHFYKSAGTTGVLPT